MFLPRYSIVYINEKSQAAIIFNNIARYLVHGRVTSKDYIFFWQSSGCSQYKYGGVCKPVQTSGLYNCQLEKLIACLYGASIKKGRQK